MAMLLLQHRLAFNRLRLPQSRIVLARRSDIVLDHERCNNYDNTCTSQCEQLAFTRHGLTAILVASGGLTGKSELGSLPSLFHPPASQSFASSNHIYKADIFWTQMLLDPLSMIIANSSRLSTYDAHDKAITRSGKRFGNCQGH